MTKLRFSTTASLKNVLLNDFDNHKSQYGRAQTKNTELKISGTVIDNVKIPMADLGFVTTMSSEYGIVGFNVPLDTL